MSDLSPLAVNTRKPENNQQVRKMVKTMVKNLEDLQGNINDVLGDLKDLLQQIDNVTSKIDSVCGPQCRKSVESDVHFEIKSSKSTGNNSEYGVNLRKSFEDTSGSEVHLKKSSSGNSECEFHSNKTKGYNHSVLKSRKATRDNYICKLKFGDQKENMGISRSISVPCQMIEPETKNASFRLSVGSDQYSNFHLNFKQSDISKNKLHVEEIRPYDVSPDLDLSYLHITPGEQRSRWGRSLAVSDGLPHGVNTNTLKLTDSWVENVKRQSKQGGKWMGNIRQDVGDALSSNEPRDTVNGSRTSVEQPNLLIDSQNSDIWNSNQTDNSSPLTAIPIARCYAQIKPGEKYAYQSPTSPTEGEARIATLDTLGNILGADKLDIGSSGSDIGYIPGDSVSPEVDDLISDLILNGFPVDMFNSKMVNVDSGSEQSSAEYDGMYEQLMETQLENLSSSDCSEYTETSEWNMELGSAEKSDTDYSDDIEVRYDRDINTWTSYTLGHMNSSMKSSDSCLSDTPSDILNDNTNATITYGNMIFSDQLILLNRKRNSREKNQNQNVN